MYLPLMIFVVAVISPAPVPTEPKDQEPLQEVVRLWADMIDQDITRAARSGTDPKAKIDKLLDLLAADPYFDLQREAKLHPRHREYVKSVAALRGVALAEPAPEAKLAEMLVSVGLPSGLLIWWISVWNRRAERKLRARDSRARHYRSLLLRMSWRYFIVTGALLVVILALDSSGRYTSDQVIEHAAFFYVLAAICLGIVLIYSWTLTARRFSQQATAAIT